MTNPAGSNVTQCSYTLLDNGVHVLVFASSSAAAVAELFILLSQLYEGKTRQDPPLRILIDADASGLPPLNRLLPGARTLVAQHPDRPEVQYAFILPNGSNYLISTIETFIRLLRPTNKVQSFSPAHRADAIAWLLGDNKAQAR